MRDIKSKVKKNPFILYLWNEKRRFEGEKAKKKISDYEFIRNEYLKRTGYHINLAEPQRYTEKLQWLKLFYRDSLIKICTDKYTARNYVKALGYEWLLNDLIGTYDSIDQIDIDVLPSQFVLKVSNGSGWNIICKDKKKINWMLYRRIINSWMKQNLYIYGREWNYDGLTSKIIIEKYIDSGDGQLTDYKLFCFDGKVAFIQVDRERFGSHKQSYYDTDWNLLPFTTGHYGVSEPKPKRLEQMKIIAEHLSEAFPHVRIDLYNIGSRIYFGEFTFFDGSGFYRYNPDEWDYHWGKYLKLPKANYNKNLYSSLMKKG